MKCLSQLQPGHRSGYGHDLPDDWHSKPIWTVIREPASWLGSAWAHRVREKWHMYPHKVPWQHFCKLTELMATDDFEHFVDRVTTELPGLITWLFRCYTPPGVLTVRFGEEIYNYLQKLGCDTTITERMNTGHNSPEISKEVRTKIWAAETEAYGRYGFHIDGEYFYTIGDGSYAASR